MAFILNIRRPLSGGFIQNKHILVSTLCRSLATHWLPRFRKLRAQKVIKPKLPEYEKIKGNFYRTETVEERRARNIKDGILPPISFEYKPINISTSGEVFDPYIPPEGDGKTSLFSKSFVTDKYAQLTKFYQKKTKHERLIKKHDPGFDTQSFGEHAQEIYINSHKALVNRDTDELLKHVTEHAYAKMWKNMKYKTLRWNWIESLEEPEIKNIVTRQLLSENDIFAQVTVRFHSKQTMAIYDRFGRLAFGSETLAKDIIEYVIFEMFITNPFGVWRMHDKIVPEWQPQQTPIVRSYVLPKEYEFNAQLADEMKSKFKKDDSHIKDDDAVETKQLTKS